MYSVSRFISTTDIADFGRDWKKRTRASSRRTLPARMTTMTVRSGGPAKYSLMIFWSSADRYLEPRPSPSSGFPPLPAARSDVLPSGTRTRSARQGSNRNGAVRAASITSRHFASSRLIRVRWNSPPAWSASKTSRSARNSSAM